jgi:hypothetical protein
MRLLLAITSSLFLFYRLDDGDGRSWDCFDYAVYVTGMG